MIPYQYPVMEPNCISPGSEPRDLSKFPIRTVTSIQFRVVEPTYQMITEQMEDHGLRYWKYLCYSCYAASGDPTKCFSTSWASRKRMSLGATEDQQKQMKQHAEDHSIIWSWARSQDKK